MKYSSQGKQLRLDLFSTTLEKSLDSSNRWYRLANALPWDEFERVYNKQLDNKHCGGGNKPARMAIGALIIKHKMNLSDEETIQAILENPYMQYFVGLKEFTNKPIFDSSLFVYIRKRIDIDAVNTMTLALMTGGASETESTSAKDNNDEQGDKGLPSDTEGSSESSPKDSLINVDGHLHKGSIKIDATCCEVEVKYPTDLGVLNDARDVSERLIDKLCKISGCPKPRTHRKKARSQFLSVIKKKRKPKKLIRKGIRQQLAYLRNNIGSIADIISSGSTSLYDALTRKEKQWIGTIIKVYYQQKGMFDANIHQCPNRIISVFQPHVRPIVRGKSKAKVEFGSKIGASIVQGYTFIDHFSWDAYNESEDLETHIQKYYGRFGFYPVKCYADKIYMNRKNRAILKKYHIEAAGKPLGRPTKEMQTDAYKVQAAKDIGERNEIESTFGTGKRIYRADNVRAKLPDTADAWTALCFFVKNVMKFLKGLLRLLSKTTNLDTKKLYQEVIGRMFFSFRLIA